MVIGYLCLLVAIFCDHLVLIFYLFSFDISVYFSSIFDFFISQVVFVLFLLTFFWVSLLFIFVLIRQSLSPSLYKDICSFFILCCGVSYNAIFFQADAPITRFLFSARILMRGFFKFWPPATQINIFSNKKTLKR